MLDRIRIAVHGSGLKQSRSYAPSRASVDSFCQDTIKHSRAEKRVFPIRETLHQGHLRIPHTAVEYNIEALMGIGVP